MFWSAVTLTLSAVSVHTERLFAIVVVVVAIGGLLLNPFTRRIGGNQAKGGGPGGSEKAIVGVIWFLLALGAGIYLAHSAATVAVG